jgi:hypothetical protein
LYHAGFSLADFSTLKMKAIRSSETSVQTRSTQHYFPEDGILQEKQMFLAPTLNVMSFTSSPHYFSLLSLVLFKYLLENYSLADKEMIESKYKITGKR